MNHPSVLSMALILTHVVAWLGLSGCQQGNASTQGGSLEAVSPRTAASERRYPIKIVTTCGMVTDIVRQVTGDKGEVVGLMGEGVDPHLYKPTRNDVKQLLDADMVFYSGLLLEGRMSDTFAQVARGGKPVYAVTEAIDESNLREPPEFQGHYDPHVWMDVKSWSVCVAFVAKVMAEYDPKNADHYQQNAAAYRSELTKLDAYVRQCIQTIPEAQRVLITAHDAFGYFSTAYGIEVRSVQGVSTESEAGINDITELVNFIVHRKIKSIFVESSVSEKNIRAIVEGAEKQDWRVSIGGSLFSDAMGKPGTYEGHYIGMIDHNVTTITRALGGTAPERGFQGKLGL